MLVYVWLYFIAKIALTSCQFKDHIDLQKISEIIFRNQKYNVLKPTVHIIKDHLAEFIQKRHNTDTSERMFLDANGLQHIWKGLEVPQLINFRKADTSQKTEGKLSNDTINITTTGNTNSSVNDLTAKDKPQRSTYIISSTSEQPIKTDLRDGDTLVKTTFFCPFFGVVRMKTKVPKFTKDK